jgi:hypothetical protein
LVGENEVTRTWLTLASSPFSTNSAPQRFETDISFDEFVFPSDARFEDAIFVRIARFERARFAGSARFDRAVFSGGAWFERATFSDPAWFFRATFGGEARFDDAIFSSYARFERTTFDDPGSFVRATFKGAARFDRAIFRGDALFFNAAFNDGGDFPLAKFRRHATFANSFFGRSASFQAVATAGIFWLAGATFREVPNFLGATFECALRLDNVATPRYRLFGYTPDKDAAALFRVLRRQTREGLDRDRELEFFAQEVRTGRFHAKGWPSWVPKVGSWRFWFGLAFGTFSDFGRSLWRPLLTWFALSILFAAFYLGEHEDMRKARAELGAAWST